MHQRFPDQNHCHCDRLSDVVIPEAKRRGTDRISAVSSAKRRWLTPARQSHLHLGPHNPLTISIVGTSLPILFSNRIQLKCFFPSTQPTR